MSIGVVERCFGGRASGRGTEMLWGECFGAVKLYGLPVITFVDMCDV